MKISGFLAVASFAFFTCHANADPIIKLTFDMSFRGYTTRNYNEFGGYFTDPSQPIHDTVVVTLPFKVRNVQEYNDNYANNFILNLGNEGLSAGLTITSGKISTLFSSEEYNTLVNNELKKIGITATEPSSTYPFSRDYAFISKRDVHGVASAQEYYTWIDASTEITKTAIGLDNAKFLQMVRLEGSIFGQPGNLDPFSLSDVPAMLLNINTQQSPGFSVSYTSFVSTYSSIDGSYTGRPLEVRYQGNGRLTGFTIDGVDQMPSSVPEPETYAMLLAGLGMIGLLARRRRA